MQVSGVPSPSMVVISSPSCITARDRQELIRRPSAITVQAPHWPWSQPFLVPVRWRCSRRASSRVVRVSSSSVVDLAVHREGNLPTTAGLVPGTGGVRPAAGQPAAAAAAAPSARKWRRDISKSSGPCNGYSPVADLGVAGENPPGPARGRPTSSRRKQPLRQDEKGQRRLYPFLGALPAGVGKIASAIPPAACGGRPNGGRTVAERPFRRCGWPFRGRRSGFCARTSLGILASPRPKLSDLLSIRAPDNTLSPPFCIPCIWHPGGQPCPTRPSTLRRTK